MPFIAMWKNEPSWRMGRKKSADRKMTAKQPQNGMRPARNSRTASTMPSAAPPYATRSMMVMELSCIVSTFMVILRNFSASRFISSCL